METMGAFAGVGNIAQVAFVVRDLNRAVAAGAGGPGSRAGLAPSFALAAGQPGASHAVLDGREWFAGHHLTIIRRRDATQRWASGRAAVARARVNALSARVSMD